MPRSLKKGPFVDGHLLKKIDGLQKILNDKSTLIEVVKGELEEVIKDFGDERKTLVNDATIPEVFNVTVSPISNSF